MSIDDPPTSDAQPDDEESLAWLREHREELEREADGNSPAAWVCKRLLHSLEEADES